MPTYEYKCLRCGAVEEHFAQRQLPDIIFPCAKCGERLKRQIGAGAAVIFKGSGFYATDHRSKSYAEGATKAAKEAE